MGRKLTLFIRWSTPELHVTRTCHPLPERVKYRSEVPQRTPPQRPPTDLDELSDVERDLIQPLCA